MSMLETLGWGPFFSSQVEPSELDLLPGRAVEDRGPRLLVRFESGDRLVTIPGRLRAAGAVPVVGDFVLAAPGDEPAIARGLARRSRLARGAAGRATAEQVLAANVDLVLAVQGADAGPKPRRLERTLAAIAAGGAEPVVVVSKLDLCVDPAAALAGVAAAAPGVRVVGVSATRGDGMDALRALVAPGQTAVLVGPSGAGKSTLVNALLGAPVQATASVREADRRGRHTTSGRRLLVLPGGGAVIDGPGIRELKLWDAAGLDGAFTDLTDLAAGCRFRDCRHDTEPGCAVRAAVEAGALAAERLESARKLAREAEAQAARRDGASGAAERARWRGVSRAIRRFYRDRGRG